MWSLLPGFLVLTGLSAELDGCRSRCPSSALMLRTFLCNISECKGRAFLSGRQVPFSQMARRVETQGPALLACDHGTGKGAGDRCPLTPKA